MTSEDQTLDIYDPHDVAAGAVATEIGMATA